jgi:hypothetical protein
LRSLLNDFNMSHIGFSSFRKRWRSAAVDFDRRKVDGYPAGLQGRPANLDILISELTFFMIQKEVL